jgi:hypothetical protein
MTMVTLSHLLLCPAPACIKHFVSACILISMEATPEGLTDKLFWRSTRDEWHCFKRLESTRICLAMPTPANRRGARATDRSPRRCLALRAV